MAVAIENSVQSSTGLLLSWVHSVCFQFNVTWYLTCLLTCWI